MLKSVNLKIIISFSFILLISITIALNDSDSSKTTQTTASSQTPVIELPVETVNAVDLLNEEPPAEKNETTLKGIIGKKPVYDELVNRGVSPNEVVILANSFKPIFNFRKAATGDTFSMLLNDEKQLQEFIYIKGVLDQYIATKHTTGGFNVLKREPALDKEFVAKEFIIDSSLYDAMISQGEDSRLVNKLTDIFSWDIDFYYYPRKGDRIRILYERFSKDGRFIYYGKVLAAQYHGANGTHSAYLSLNRGNNSYFDDNGNSLEKMFLKTPLKFGKKTSSYSKRRFHPVTKKYKKHTGIDYGARIGTRIFATAGGKVVYSGWRGSYGKLIILRHTNGYQTYYAHCNKLIAKAGDYIDQGQIIASVGKTGRVTGPHVHYEVRNNGKPVNPNSLKSKSIKPIRQEMLSYYHANVCKMVSDMSTIISQKNKSVPESPLKYASKVPGIQKNSG